MINVKLLVDEIKVKGFTFQQISDILKVNISTFYRKLKCPESFTIEQVDILFKVLRLDVSKACSIFFASPVA